jgi:hypothetical protein
MLRTIEFNDEKSLGSVKVDNVPSDWALPVELNSKNLLTSNFQPQLALSIRQIPAKFSRERF